MRDRDPYLLAHFLNACNSQTWWGQSEGLELHQGLPHWWKDPKYLKPGTMIQVTYAKYLLLILKFFVNYIMPTKMI